MVNAFQKLEERMYGVLCNSEKSSTKAAVDAFAGMGVQVTVEDFVPFMGMGKFFFFFLNIFFVNLLIRSCFSFLVFFQVFDAKDGYEIIIASRGSGYWFLNNWTNTLEQLKQDQMVSEQLNQHQPVPTGSWLKSSFLICMFGNHWQFWVFLLTSLASLDIIP